MFTLPKCYIIMRVHIFILLDASQFSINCFIIFDIFKKSNIGFMPGDYCESVIPDPIPNSVVKPFCADGTLS